MSATDTVLHELRCLEERLLALGPVCTRACAEALLAPGFREFGGSGRMLDRSAVLQEIADAGTRAFTISDVQLRTLSDDAALLTYRAIVNGRESLRSSVWVRRNGRWQMLFHQGTRTPSQDSAQP